MNLSRLLTGTIMLLLGGSLVSIPIIFRGGVSYVSLFYGIPISLIGLYILFNRSEDKIEKIKPIKSWEDKNE